MILGFGYSEEEKGYYAGLVASSVFAGRAAGSYFWGWLSDRKGRKLVLLLTLGGSGVFSLLFGFTQNLAMAIAARFFTGLFSGILGTAKTVLYEVSDNTNQAMGMSMISLAWGAGIILGPATGGYLASPVVKYPETFSPGFFTRFPYIIPAIVTFFVNVIVFLVLAFKMKETLHSRDFLIKNIESEPLQDGGQVRNGCRCNDLRRHKSHNDVTESYRRADISTNYDSRSTEINELSQNNGNRISDTHKTNDNESKNEVQNEASTARLYSSVPNISSVPNSESVITSTERECMCDLYNQRMDDTRMLKDDDGKSFHSAHGLESDSQKQSCQNSGICVAVRESALVTNMRQNDVRQSVILFTVFSFAIIGFEDVFNVWASTETRLDGLGFSTDKIGTVLSMVGIPLLLLLIFIFSTLERNFGIKKTYMICAFIMMVSVTACPVLHLLSDRPTVLWPVMLLILIPERLCASCCFSATALFINNSVTPDNAGAVNGIGMTFTAIARTLAPAMGGSVFAWTVSRGSGPPLDVSFAFFLFGVVFWITILMCLILPERLNRQKK
ncbi:protein ZINC INDUCED FACILITATOR-LIKE 1-like isoform X2 [Haliotis rubra]|nr:protein ZINC INDUCED FACILITATOR-LIKE 1-like isoform X2 [Haliotis rubra]